MRRPRSVTWLCIILLGLTAFSALGVVSVSQRFDFLNQQPLSVSPWYLLISDAVWATVFGALTPGLWRMRAWARVGAPVALTLYLAQSWLERLFLSRSDYLQATIPCALVFHIIALALAWGLLWRPGARRRFK
jgi:hypothetical protein